MKFPKRKNSCQVDEYIALEAEALNKGDLRAALEKALKLLTLLRVYGPYFSEDDVNERRRLGVNMFIYDENFRSEYNPAYRGDYMIARDRAEAEKHNLVEAIIWYIEQVLGRMQ
jgi:hypothetical protein